MSYSSSREAGLIKVERDNSLSCSLELTTLVIPWEIFYVLCIKFVSLPVSHGHTFLLYYSPASSRPIFQACLSFFLFNILFLSHLSSHFLSFLSPRTCFIHPIFLSFKSYPCPSLCLYIYFQIFGLALSSFPPSLLFLLSHCTVYPSRAGYRNLPVGPVSPSTVSRADRSVELLNSPES